MLELAITDDTEPREIAAWLHELIAAKSPEHAGLVAAFEDRNAGKVRPGPPQRFPRSPYLPRLERLGRYCVLRGSGTGKKAAATQVGIRPRTADRYETAWLATLGGGS